jgi:hypothetical protein
VAIIRNPIGSLLSVIYIDLYFFPLREQLNRLMRDGGNTGSHMDDADSMVKNVTRG